MNSLDVKRMLLQCEATAEVLKSLAHPRRLQLLCHLSDEPRTVGELESLCEISQSQASQFLLRLKKEGLLASEREGKFVRYRIADPKVSKLIQALHRIFCP